MKHSLFNPARTLRLALLLLMLASQGLAFAHELGDHHSIKADPCSICILGHGLGAVADNSQALYRLPVCRGGDSLHAIPAAVVFTARDHLARAPPLSR